MQVGHPVFAGAGRHGPEVLAGTDLAIRNHFQVNRVTPGRIGVSSTRRATTDCLAYGLVSRLTVSHRSVRPLFCARAFISFVRSCTRIQHFVPHRQGRSSLSLGDCQLETFDFLSRFFEIRGDVSDQVVSVRLFLGLVVKQIDLLCRVQGSSAWAAVIVLDHRAGLPPYSSLAYGLAQQRMVLHRCDFLIVSGGPPTAQIHTIINNQLFILATLLLSLSEVLIDFCLITHLLRPAHLMDPLLMQH